MAYPAGVGGSVRSSVEFLADENEESFRVAFLGYVSGLLEEDGQLVGPELLLNPAGLIEGLDWDQNLGRLTVLINQFDPQGWGASRDVATIAEVSESAFSQILGILTNVSTTKPLGGAFKDDSIEMFIAEICDNLSEVRFLILTNAFVADQSSIHLEGGVPCVAQTVDLGQLRRFLKGGGLRGRDVSFVTQSRSGLPTLGPFGSEDLASYLVVVEGDLLADLYHEQGAGILGRNVRAFLQVRNRVNKGMQDSLDTQSGNFFAFNNGLSLTASGVTRSLAGGQAVITSAQDLEIVNGGQTTASLHYAKYHRGIDLSGVVVQAKLTVVSGLKGESVALSIARFANTQSPVRMGDLSSNNPLFIAVELLSRSIQFHKEGAPLFWYFERVRGQFLAEQSEAVVSGDADIFTGRFDRSRKLDKAQLARLELTSMLKPHIVTAGGERSLSSFAMSIANDGLGVGRPDDAYFRRLVGRQILWLAADKVIGGLKLGGHKATDVAYTMAMLFFTSQNRLRLDVVAEDQDAGVAFRAAITELAPLVHERLLTSAGSRNAHSWAKTEGAWEAVKALSWSIPTGLVGAHVSTGQTRRAVVKAGAVAPDLPISAAAEAAAARVVEFGADAWFDLSKWAKEADQLMSWQRSIAFSLGRVLSSGRLPTEKQVVQAVKIMEAASQLGFRPSAS